MPNAERRFQQTWLSVQTIRFVSAMTFVQKRLISCLNRRVRVECFSSTSIYLWEVTFVVQNLKDSVRFLVDQIETIGVIGEVDAFPGEFLLRVFLLFQFEDMSIEMKLQGFVGVVNTQLFKTIRREIFETKNVQNRNTIVHGPVHSNDLIDSSDQPAEQRGVKSFGNGISRTMRCVSLVLGETNERTSSRALVRD